MENDKISQKENVIVKKGILYYLFKGISLILKAIFLCFKVAFYNFSKYSADIKEMVDKDKKTKRLLNRKVIDEEIV
jgi:hypothetical protein